ncbi:YhdP family protein [Actibacterium sp. D379-3]
MTETEPQPQPPRRRMRFGIWLLLSLALMAGLFLLAVLSLTERTLTVPAWATDRVAERLNAVLAPAALDLGAVQVVFSRKAPPQVHLLDATLSDANGRPLARMPDMQVTLAARALLDRRIEVRRVALSGPEITIRRAADGRLDLALGDAVAPFSAASVAQVLEQLDQALTVPALAAVEGVSAEGLQLRYVDARAGRAWLVRDGLLTLDQTASDLSAQLFFSLTSDQGVPSEVAMSFETLKGSAESRMSASFSDLPAADIATQSPALAFLTVLDAPISGAVRTGVSAGGSLAPLSAALEIGAGALHPVEGAAPIRFDRGKSYFRYDPAQDRITFDEVSVKTGAVSLTAEGHAYLRDYVGGWPTSLITQMRLRQVALTPKGVFAEPARFSAGAADLKLTLDPFTATIGQASLTDEAGVEYRGSGVVRAGREGWQIALDMTLDQITDTHLLQLWPVDLVPRTRQWVADNVQDALIFNVQGALRRAPGAPAVASLGYDFRDATVRFMKTMPPVEQGYGYAMIADESFTLVLESGTVAAPSGGAVDAAGTVVRVPDITERPARGEITLKTDSSVEAMLSLLDQPPLELMSKAGQPVALAEGRAQMVAQLSVPFVGGTQPQDVAYSVSGTLSDLRSGVIVNNRVIAAQQLTLNADATELSIAGQATLDGLPVQGVWSQPLGPAHKGSSRVEGTVELSQRAVDIFKIGLPAGSVTGRGLGAITLDLVQGQPARFALSSDLNRVGLHLPGLGWSKAKSAKGTLEVTGSLGTPPVVESLNFTAPGLRADGGRVAITADGALQEARFSRVRLGGWLDAPVTLAGRGAARPPAVVLGGGRVDLRNLPKAWGGGNGGSGAATGPVQVALDRLVVSGGIALRDLRGTLSQAGGLNGQLTGTVEGGAPVAVTLAPARGGTGVRVRSDDAGGVLRGAGIFEKSNGGTLDLVLTPRGAPGDYDGTLSIKRTRVKGAPALAEMLSAISVVGLLEMLDGEGLVFSEVSSEFRLTPDALQVTRGSAVGPSLGISMAGVYLFGTNRMHMQGVISPIYLLNGIGAIFTRKGEGLFGFNYSLKGDPKNLRVGVNPLSILTPGMFREIFRSPAPELAK